MSFKNFYPLTKKSLSIAFSIIDIILCFVFFIIGLNYTGRVVIGFLLISIGFIFSSISSILLFVKGLKFGEKKYFDLEGGNSTFKLLTSLSAIFEIIFFIMVIIGIILIII